MALNFAKAININDNDVKNTLTFSSQFNLNDNTESEPTPPPHTSSNMWDGITDIVKYYYITASGGLTRSMSYFYVETYFSVESGKSYVFWGEKKSDGQISKSNRIYWYDESQGFIERGAFSDYQKTALVAPDNAKYMRVCSNIDSTEVSDELIASYNWYVGEGTEDTEYEPY